MCLLDMLDMQLILALLLIALRLQMIIYLINVHCSHFLMTVYVWSSYAYCHISLWYLDRILLVPYTCLVFYLSLSLMKFCCYMHVFQDTCVFWCKCFTAFRFSCEWVLPMFPNSRLSLESVYGFCHGIAKGGDCKFVISNYIVLALILCQIWL